MVPAPAVTVEEVGAGEAGFAGGAAGAFFTGGDAFAEAFAAATAASADPKLIAKARLCSGDHPPK